MSLATGSNFGADALGALPGPDWLRAQRQQSWERFSALPRPTESEEIWRYSRIDDLDLEAYAPLSATQPPELGALPPDLLHFLDAAGPGSVRLVTRNGGAGQLTGAQPGLEVTSSHEPRPAEPAGDAWAALNGAFTLEPWTVRVAPGRAIAAPLVLVHWLDCEGAAIFPSVSVEVGEGGSLDVVEVLASAGPTKGLVVPLTQLHLAPGARLGFGQVQLLGPGAWQLGNQVSRLQRDTALRSMTVALGGYYARVVTSSVLEGPGGDSELVAAYFGAEDQMHDLRTIQHHAAPASRSNLIFKGAVANRAHSVYSGLIRVEKGAKGTNAFQTNRNLVLSEGAQADSVPNLEIEDNDVRCSHASAVGPIDEAQLFYLESRGVPTEAAERLIALGFMDDVLDRFPVPAMKAWLRGALAKKLADAGLGQSREEPRS